MQHIQIAELSSILYYYRRMKESSRYLFVKINEFKYKELLEQYKNQRKMKKQLIQDQQALLNSLNKERHVAMTKLTNKRKSLVKDIQEDTPDLFGERKSVRPDKLFNEPVHDVKIERILEPFRIAVSNIDRQIDKCTSDLAALANMPDVDLFTNLKQTTNQQFQLGF